MKQLLLQIKQQFGLICKVSQPTFEPTEKLQIFLFWINNKNTLQVQYIPGRIMLKKSIGSHGFKPILYQSVFGRT